MNLRKEESLAYIFDPISNTYIDDEDESLGNKLALSEDAEKIIKQIDDQFGPGTVFPASELPPKENPYKDFEDRNPAADGGMIGGGVIEGEDYGDRSGFAEPKLPKLIRLEVGEVLFVNPDEVCSASVVSKVIYLPFPILS